MKNLVIFLVLAITANIAFAEEPVYFADENLKAAVEAELGVIDPNATDMLLLTTLDGFNRGITNLTGMEYASNLQQLILGYNGIIDISPVSGLINLYVLELGGNQISNISPISGLTNLSRLYLYENQIIDISPVSGLTDLTILYLHRNQISDISPVLQLSNLTHLSLSYNPISDISPVSQLTNLVELGLANNGINDISPVSGLKNLKFLGLGGNQIGDISPISGLTKMTHLSLGYNQISNISPISLLTKMVSLYMENNQISDISALSGMASLRRVYLYNNQISDISALSGKGLYVLYLAGNQISDISAVSGLTHLTTLSLYDNDISDISALSGLTTLRYLYLYANNISDISALLLLTNLSRLNLSYNPLDCPAYDIYIPMIKENNPGIYLTYDPRPEYCDYQPDIEVSPLSYDFGDVNLGTSRSVLVTIFNIGNEELTLESLDFTPDSNSDFAITSAPSLPSVIAPEGSNDVEVTFTPSVDGNSFAVLEISSDDIDESIVEVYLTGVGVVIEVPPSEQIEQIIEFIDTSVADGNLVGVGPGNSANKKLNALINMFEATSDLIVGEYFDDACGQLVDILKKCDGQVPPPDFVSGEAAEELANMILELMEDLECE